MASQPMQLLGTGMADACGRGRAYFLKMYDDLQDRQI